MTYWIDRYTKPYKDPYGKPVTFVEWYEGHATAKPYRDRIMKAINQLRFKSLWDEMLNTLYKDPTGVDERLYHFVCDVRKLAGMPKMSKEMYDEGRLYRHIYVGKYTYALEEMWLLCWGDW